jgi:hypothetical protein
MLDKTAEDNLKDVLLTVLRVDTIVNKFHNKVNFMNLNFMMQRIESWDAERIEKVKEAMGPVYDELLKVQQVIDELQDPVQNLIESYAFVGETSEETTEL